MFVERSKMEDIWLQNFFEIMEDELADGGASTIQQMYPTVANSLPQSWNQKDKHDFIVLSNNFLVVNYKGECVIWPHSHLCCCCRLLSRRLYDVTLRGFINILYINTWMTLGRGKTPKDAASVRANSPIPSSCGIYYFEVKIISKGRDGWV